MDAFIIKVLSMINILCSYDLTGHGKFEAQHNVWVQNAASHGNLSGLLHQLNRPAAYTSMTRLFMPLLIYNDALWTCIQFN